jgi:PilZ domain
MDGATAEPRRKSPRSRIVSSELAYLNFRSGNGAIVLDVSSSGLGFQAADPLEPNESLSFRFAVANRPDLDLFGRVVWLDDTRRRGGLLLDVPVAARTVFRQWQRKYLGSLPEIEEPSSPTLAVPPAASPADEPAPLSPQQTLDSAPLAADRPFEPMLGSRGSIFVSKWDLPEEDRHTARNVLIASVILALGLVVAGTYYFGGRRQIGGLLIRLGQSVAGANPQTPAQAPPAQRASSQNAEAAPAAPVATPNASRASVPAPLAPNAVIHEPAANAPRLAAPELAQQLPAPHAPQPANAHASSARAPAPSAMSARVAAASNPRPAASPAGAQPSHPPANAHAAPASSSAPSASSPPADHGQAYVAQARKYLRSSDPADSALAANLLWSAIQAGNAQAELMLADLYLRGQGVPKNCRQAEALLNAAQAANVPGSSEKLQELQTYGCR